MILISGRGSNLSSILEAQSKKAWKATILKVISNRPDAFGIEIARGYGIPVEVIDHEKFLTRAEFDQALYAAVESLGTDLVVLAGFMRILPDFFVTHFSGRLMNIHPSLLPSFTGLRTHRQALDQGVKFHGATVHFVTNEMDVGPIIAQGVVPVQLNDTEESLSQRVLKIEHIIYVQAIEWFINDQIEIHEGIVSINPPSPQSFSIVGD